MNPSYQIDKKEVFEKILAKLAEEAKSVGATAKSAHEAATHDESRAEDHHDTRAIEASYLASAASGRAAELERLVTYVRQLTPAPRSRAEPGALVTLQGQKRLFCFLAAHGGGPSVAVGGSTVQWVTPKSPLGEAVFGTQAGDVIEVETQGKSLEYEVESID